MLAPSPRHAALALLLALAACGAPAGVPAVPPRAGEVAQPGPLAPAGPVAAVEPEIAQRLEALARTIEEERLELHLPGVALAIVQAGRLIFARGFGQADVEAARPVTPETLFAIGSTTKAFTATLVGMLADEEKLAFDDPITAHLAWFALPIDGEEGEQVTFRDLLAHRTGFARMDVLWAGGKASREEVLRTALRAEPIAPFREKFLYNNIMFLAAGEACAAVVGKAWEELVRERFFEPLGMRASVASVTEAQRDPRLALGYRWNEETQVFEHLPMRRLDSIAPAGSINSNVLDMARWVRFLLGRGELDGRRLISLDSFAETWKPHNTMSSDARYGLGWMLREWRGQPYVEHGGNIDGFAAQVSLLPESGLGLVMLTNVSATPLQGTIGPQVFEALLGKTEEAPAAASEDLARFTGTYVANYFQFHDAPFEVLVRNGRLAIDVPGQMVFELLPPGPEGKRPFALVPEQIQADFEEVDGRVVALRLYQGGLVFEVPREGWVPPPELDPAELAPYLGSYADPLTKKVLAVVVSRGRLAVDYPEQMVYELLPPADGERWTFRATPQMAVEFHLDADGLAESLTFHERGTFRECERVGAGGLAMPSLAELLALRKASETEARLAELGLCRLAGTIRFVHCGIEGTTHLLLDARGRLDETTDLRPFAWTRTVFDGERARHWSTLEKERDLTGKSLDQLRAGTAALLGDWSRRFDSAVIERVDEANGRRSARVRLVEGEAPPVVVHVDLATGDLLCAEVSEVVDGGATYPKTVTFEDWRELEGLRLPMRVVSEDDAAGRIVFQYETLETRLASPAEPFAFEGIAPPE
jgi:CubicO group peptidase (beta-lactamase class C family)